MWVFESYCEVNFPRQMLDLSRLTSALDLDSHGRLG